MLCFYSGESCRDEALTIVKAKCTWIVSEEVNEAVNDNVAWSSGGIMQVAFHDNMFMCLNFSMATRTSSWEVREESLSIFSNGGMTSHHASKLCTQ